MLSVESYLNRSQSSSDKNRNVGNLVCTEGLEVQSNNSGRSAPLRCDCNRGYRPRSI